MSALPRPCAPAGRAFTVEARALGPCQDWCSSQTAGKAGPRQFFVCACIGVWRVNAVLCSPALVSGPPVCITSPFPTETPPASSPVRLCACTATSWQLHLLQAMGLNRIDAALSRHLWPTAASAACSTTTCT
eukprot:364487-Chlamydomonas_euryale.AAC.38